MSKESIAPMSEKTAAAVEAFFQDRGLSPGEAQSLIEIMNKAERSDLLLMDTFLRGVNAGRMDERIRRDKMEKEIARRVKVALSQHFEQEKEAAS